MEETATVVLNVAVVLVNFMAKYMESNFILVNLAIMWVKLDVPSMKIDHKNLVEDSDANG